MKAFWAALGHGFKAVAIGAAKGAVWATKNDPQLIQLLIAGVNAAAKQ